MNKSEALEVLKENKFNLSSTWGNPRIKFINPKIVKLWQYLENNITLWNKYHNKAIFESQSNLIKDLENQINE